MAWIGAVVSAGMGIYQAVSASKAAKNLPDAKSYGATPQMKRAEEMALRRAEQGVSPAERALFEQGMARRTGAAERAMRNIGMSGVAQGVSNIFNIDAMNQFSAQSEAERRKGEAMYAGIAGQMQGIQDRETSSFNQMLQQQRTALGGAAASGMKNIAGAAGMAAQAYNTNKLAEAYANSGDTYNYNLGGGGPMGKMEAPTPDLLPTVDTSAPPAIPAGAGYPGITAPDSSSATASPFGSNVQAERAFQDYANAQAGYDITKGYGWGPASSAAYNSYGGGYAGLPTPLTTMSSYQLPTDPFSGF